MHNDGMFPALLPAKKVLFSKLNEGKFSLELASRLLKINITSQYVALSLISIFTVDIISQSDPLY